MRLFVGLIELRIFGSGSPAPANDFSLFLWLLHVFVMNFLMFTQPATYFETSQMNSIWYSLLSLSTTYNIVELVADKTVDMEKKKKGEEESGGR